MCATTEEVKCTFQKAKARGYRSSPGKQCLEPTLHQGQWGMGKTGQVNGHPAILQLGLEETQSVPTASISIFKTSFLATISFLHPLSKILIGLWLWLLSYKSEFTDPITHNSKKLGYLFSLIIFEIKHSKSREHQGVCSHYRERPHCYNVG